MGKDKVIDTKLPVMLFHADSDYYSSDDRFKMAKIFICYEGENRNSSYISESTLEEMAKGIYGIPVVGAYNKEKQDFEGHNSYLKLNDDGTIEAGKDTISYGFVPESAEVNWEYIADKETGITKRYLTTTVVLWTGEYPEVERVFEGKNNHSMEISVIDGDWDDGYDVFEIHDAKFNALCILGEDVESCFEDSKIVSFSKSNGFNEEYSRMLSEYNKFTKSKKKGDGNVANKNKEFNENLTEPTVEPTVTDEPVASTTEEPKVVNSTEEANVSHETPKSVEPENEEGYTKEDEEGVDLSSILGELADVKRQMAEFKKENEYLKEFKKEQEAKEFELFKQNAIEKYSSLLKKETIEEIFTNNPSASKSEIETLLAVEYTNLDLKNKGVSTSFSNDGLVMKSPEVKEKSFFDKYLNNK